MGSLRKDGEPESPVTTSTAEETAIEQPMPVYAPLPASFPPAAKPRRSATGATQAQSGNGVNVPANAAGASAVADGTGKPRTTGATGEIQSIVPICRMFRYRKRTTMSAPAPAASRRCRSPVRRRCLKAGKPWLEASHDPCGSAHCHERHAAAARAYVGIIGRSCRQIRQGRGVGRRRNAPVIRSVGIGARKPMEQPSPDHRSRVRG